jgi:hypothetical protein
MLSLLLMGWRTYIFWPSRDKTKLEKKYWETTIASKPKSVETADSMTSNQIVAKSNSSIIKNNSVLWEWPLYDFQNYSKQTL